MADQKLSPPPATEQAESPEGKPEQPRRQLTRRDFLIRSNAGAVAVGVLTGTGFAALATPSAQAAQAAPAAPALAPLKSRRVKLDIDGKQHEVNVDVRESLWETLNYQLGLSNCNLGCDRAQCGACTVLVDGRAVNGCTVLSARLGRGQKILTVAGIASGPGPQGLHPVQRAFWLDGGFQCGICTRGFVMAAYALLQTNTNPSSEEIREALAGNICRCGEYAKMYDSVRNAAAEMRGETVSYAAPLILPDDPEPAAAPAGGGVSKQFQYVTPMGTIEQFDDLALELRQAPGVTGVSGTERTVTVTWNPAQLDEAGVRQLLAELGYAVRP